MLYKITPKYDQPIYKEFKSIYQVIAYYDKVLQKDYEIEIANIETENNQRYADMVVENEFYEI